MVRGKKSSYASRDEKSLEELLRLIPTEVFVVAVGKSGLTVPDARALCEKFKELKD